MHTGSCRLLLTYGNQMCMEEQVPGQQGAAWRASERAAAAWQPWWLAGQAWLTPASCLHPAPTTLIPSLLLCHEGVVSTL